MSLINEALKRAKQAQRESLAPTPPLHLRPVEPHAKVIRGIGLVLPGFLTLIALLALFLIWQVTASKQQAQSRQTAPTVARALTPATPVATQPAPAPAAPAAPTPAQPVASPVVVAPAGNPEADPDPATSSLPRAALTSTNPDPALVVVPTPEPPQFRLQSIVFHPTRPSAMVNGKTLFIGDRLGPLRVTAITLSSVTLTGPGTTNRLELAD